MICTECQAKIPTLKTRLNRVNEALHKLGLELHGSIPYMRIDTALQTNGFTVPAYSEIKIDGNLSRSHDEVGEGKYITVSIYRMDSGRYEVVAYVN